MVCVPTQCVTSGHLCNSTSSFRSCPCSLDLLYSAQIHAESMERPNGWRCRRSICCPNCASSFQFLSGGAACIPFLEEVLCFVTFWWIWGLNPDFVCVDKWSAAEPYPSLPPFVDNASLILAEWARNCVTGQWPAGPLSGDEFGVLEGLRGQCEASGDW